MAMHRSIETEIPAPPARVFAALQSLQAYPEWLDLVAAVEPADAAADDTDDAWWVTLRAKVGPFSRSKRLRMMRSVSDEPSHLRFERHETDGREHASWTFDVSIAARGDDAHSLVSVDLRYEGGLWSTPLEAVLGSQVDAAVPKLRRFVS